MRLKSFARSLAGLTFSLMFLLPAFARSAMAQSLEIRAGAGAGGVSPEQSKKIRFGLDFGDVLVGTTSYPMSVLLENTSKHKGIKIKSINVSSPFIEDSDDCDGFLGPRATCEILIEFQPTSPGEVQLNNGLVIKSNAGNSPNKFSLMGDGITGLPTPTSTPTATPTPSPSATATATATPTTSVSPTSTATATATETATSTATATVSATPTSTATATATPTVSATPTASLTATATASATATPTATATGTTGPTATATATASPTATATSTATATPTLTATATTTATSTATATATSTGTTGPTATATATASPTATATTTATGTATATSTSTGSSTPTGTATATATASPTATATTTATATATVTRTATATATSTGSSTPTATSTATATASPTATASATSTATNTATSTATATATHTATATATATGTATSTATATATPTATATGTTGPTATATSTPGAEAGSILVAGGDTGGKLGGVINLATSTVSSNNAQIFSTATDTFLLVGSLNTSRESSATIALPNDLTLIVGGEECGAMTYGSASGFQCNALQTAELYNESTKAFTVAGSGSGGLMTIARSGPTATLIEGSGTALDGQVLIVGGSTGSSFLSISTPAPGSGAPPGQTALNTAELYNPALDSFTATGSLPACAAGTSPPTCTTGLASVCPDPTTSAISTASESGTTVTITMTTANPTGLTVGSGVTIANVSQAGYNGSFTVTAMPTSTTFQYTAVATGVVAGTGGTAASDTFECGMVDQGAALIPNDSGKVLIAGGDILEFLGESSNVAFIFNPATQTFARTGSMTNARELFPLEAMNPAVVTGALSGDVVAFGGIQATSAVCLTTPTTPVLATTLNSAEVYDPTAGTWSATANTMGVKRATTATLIETGSLAGEVILPGGVDVEAGTSPSTCAATTGIKQAAQSEVDLYAPDTGTGGTFTATGSLNQAREGQGQGVLGAGTDETDLLVIGGACTTPTPSLQSVVIGSSAATITCGSANATNDYSELYSQTGGTWTVGPTFASGFSPSNGAASTVLP